MSSGADAAAAAAAAETVDLYESLYTINDIAVAVAVLFFYDSILTSDREAACFWTSKRSGASLLFFANRLISMTLYVMAMVGFATLPSDQICSVFGMAQNAVLALQFVPGAIFSALRAFVLSRSKPLGLLVLVLSLAPVGANLVLYGFQPVGEVFAPFGCLLTDNTTPALNLKLVIISRVPLIVSDTLLIYITWTKLRSWVALRESKRLSLSDILFRSGTLYFVILFFLNALHLALSVSEVTVNVGAGSYVTAFTAPITAILISRFLLDLQDANRTVVRLDPDDPPVHSPLYDDAPSFISSLGGFINPDLSGRSDDSDDSDLHVASSHSEAGKEEGEVLVQASQTAALPSSSA